MNNRKDIELSLNLAHTIKRLIEKTRVQQTEIEELKKEISVLEQQLTSSNFTDETLRMLISRIEDVHDGNRLIAKYIVKKEGDL